MKLILVINEYICFKKNNLAFCMASNSSFHVFYIMCVNIQMFVKLLVLKSMQIFFAVKWIKQYHLLYEVTLSWQKGPSIQKSCSSPKSLVGLHTCEFSRSRPTGPPILHTAWIIIIIIIIIIIYFSQAQKRLLWVRKVWVISCNWRKLWHSLAAWPARQTLQ